MTANLAAWQVVDVPAVLAVSGLLRGVVDILRLLAAVAGAPLCVAFPPGARSGPRVAQVLHQQAAAGGGQGEAGAVVPGVQVLAVERLHHLLCVIFLVCDVFSVPLARQGSAWQT